MERLPDKLVEAMVGPGLGKISELKRVSCLFPPSSPTEQATSLCSQNKRSQEDPSDFKDAKYRMIFHDLLENTVLPPEDKTVDRLWQEGQLLLSARTLTTATTILPALVYLLLNPERMQVLLVELEAAIPNITQPKSQAELERLPYFVRARIPYHYDNLVANYLQSAVVTETFRLVCAVSARLARSAPTEALQLGGWTIPPNVSSRNNLKHILFTRVQTAVSMRTPLIHHSADIFLEPWSFIPERWLPSPHSEMQARVAAK